MESLDINLDHICICGERWMWLEKVHERFLDIWQYLDLGKNYKGDHFIKIIVLAVVLANFSVNLILAGVIWKEGTTIEENFPPAWQMDMTGIFLYWLLSLEDPAYCGRCHPGLVIQDGYKSRIVPSLICCAMQVDILGRPALFLREWRKNGARGQERWEGGLEIMEGAKTEIRL